MRSLIVLPTRQIAEPMPISSPIVVTQDAGASRVEKANKEYGARCARPPQIETRKGSALTISYFVCSITKKCHEIVTTQLATLRTRLTAPTGGAFLTGARERCVAVRLNTTSLQKLSLQKDQNDLARPPLQMTARFMTKASVAKSARRPHHASSSAQLTQLQKETTDTHDEKLMTTRRHSTAKTEKKKARY